MPSDPPVLAVLDFGTNTLKLSVARILPDRIEELAQDNRVLRIGKAIGSDGHFVVGTRERILGALTELELIARSLGATEYFGVATQAFRSVADGPAVIEAIHTSTPWRLRIIDGREEAALTFEGLAQELPESGTGVIVDIGGGSTEIVVARKRNVDATESLQVGSGSLTDRFVLTDPPTVAELDLAGVEATRVLSASGIEPADIDMLLLSGGAGQFLDGLSWHAFDVGLSVESMESLRTHLARLSAAEIAGILGIPEARARVIPAGREIAQAAVTRWRPEAIKAVPSGIRTALIQRWRHEHIAQ